MNVEKIGIPKSKPKGIAYRQRRKLVPISLPFVMTTAGTGTRLEQKATYRNEIVQIFSTATEQFRFRIGIFGSFYAEPVGMQIAKATLVRE